MGKTRHFAFFPMNFLFLNSFSIFFLFPNSFPNYSSLFAFYFRNKMMRVLVFWTKNELRNRDFLFSFLFPHSFPNYPSLFPYFRKKIIRFNQGNS